MRRSFTRACSAALVGGALLVAAGAVAGAAPPDDDGSAAALEQFGDLAARSGYTLVDPACSASPESGSDLHVHVLRDDDGGRPVHRPHHPVARRRRRVRDPRRARPAARPVRPASPNRPPTRRRSGSTRWPTSTRCSPAIRPRSPRLQRADGAGLAGGGVRPLPAGLRRDRSPPSAVRSSRRTCT